MDYTKMNVYQKLILARKNFLKAGVNKTGKNPSLEFMYFELMDIVPAVTDIFAEIGLIGLPNIIEDEAIMKIVNTDKPNEEIEFSIPLRVIESNRGTNAVMAMGSTITYYRRYLYMMAMDVVEHDEIDGAVIADVSAEEKPKKARKMPATAQERKEIKEELTAADAPASELQVTALKNALSTLMDKQPDEEEFVQKIAVKTKGFTEITKQQCEELINGISDMLKQYEA